jgi:hypothetical protein
MSKGLGRDLISPSSGHSTVYKGFMYLGKTSDVKIRQSKSLFKDSHHRTSKKEERKFNLEETE